MTDDKSLMGGQERILRAVERVLAATQRRDQQGVKITNLASGKVQVEVHAYDDDVTLAGDRARAEFDRQMGMTSVPTAELEELRWLASIGRIAQARQADLETATRLEDSMPAHPLVGLETSGNWDMPSSVAPPAPGPVVSDA